MASQTFQARNFAQTTQAAPTYGPELGLNHYTAQHWEYNSRLARRWNLDPEPLTEESEYAILLRLARSLFLGILRVEFFEHWHRQVKCPGSIGQVIAIGRE